ncbi:hypothetical protein J5N97_009266 [Dioscorea zingiberensis]|uniref:Uncharacterized protein n=1 Tax=Dioscorea zingiberensis TaxID=325984 RepID=A0A9D5CWV4_9LILI|nr:hypothetical protein J5N97_009266 [Dioscorea zingiberensis]
MDGGKLLSDHHSKHGDKGTWHPKRAHTVVNKKMKKVKTNTNAANEEIKKGTFQAIPEYSDLELLINEEDENVGDYLDERPGNAIELELTRMWKTQLSGGEGIQANAPNDTPSGKETGGNIPTTPVVVSLDLDPLDINKPKRQEVNFENLLLTSEEIIPEEAQQVQQLQRQQEDAPSIRRSVRPLLSDLKPQSLFPEYVEKYNQQKAAEQSTSDEQLQECQSSDPETANEGIVAIGVADQAVNQQHIEHHPANWRRRFLHLCLILMTLVFLAFAVALPVRGLSHHRK